MKVKGFGFEEFEIVATPYVAADRELPEVSNRKKDEAHVTIAISELGRIAFELPIFGGIS